MIMVWANGGRNSKSMDAAVGSPMYASKWSEAQTSMNTFLYRQYVPHDCLTAAADAIQALSIGGMGALRFAFKYPQMFSSVFGIAPAWTTRL
jgi:S-formylglutathione hydrolase FrmB